MTPAEHAAERRRQSVRALIVVGCLALFGVGVIALRLWIEANAH